MKAATPPETALITALAHDGRGIARMDGKAVFVAGALPGETVTLRRRARRSSFDEAELVEVLEPSPERVEPLCKAFGVCGGCLMQHASPALQRQAKQAALLDELQRIGKVIPEQVLEPLAGPVWAYRRRARLGVKYVAKKERVLVGFRERSAPYIADIAACEVLSEPLGKMVLPLAELVGSLSIRDQVPQIEVAVADESIALVFRNLKPITEADREKLLTFGTQHRVDVWLQPGGIATAAPLLPSQALTYRIPDYQVELEFQPLDFIQVNGSLNQQMIGHALTWLEASSTDSVLDLYCGLGNFTLPLARVCGSVHGVEGDAGLIDRARANAQRNGITNATFAVADLSQDITGLAWAKDRYDRILLDPPRVGAREMLPLIAAKTPARVVYISCHPGSLARDAGILVEEHGFKLIAAGIMDMFPHTAHVESIAVFEPR